uniref:Putative secreted protein n=1 Tax=Anopheles marajoara TaxID=58244 RepID=A0A2M4CC07_9DIPT
MGSLRNISYFLAILSICIACARERRLYLPVGYVSQFRMRTSNKDLLLVWRGERCGETYQNITPHLFTNARFTITSNGPK